MAKRPFTIWIAFADVAFVLFVAGVIAASGYRGEANAEQQRAKRAEQERDAARAQLRRAMRCSDIQPLLSGLTDCLARSTSADAVRADRCSVTIREDLLRFETARARPIDPARAHAVAQCVYTSMRDFDRQFPDAARTVASISIDGYTDCQGELSSNMQLGSARATALFELILGEMVHDPKRTSATEHDLLSKLAVRSFGEQRPVAGSHCAELGSFAADRRVTIAVEMQPQIASEAASQ